MFQGPGGASLLPYSHSGKVLCEGSEAQRAYIQGSPVPKCHRLHSGPGLKPHAPALGPLRGRNRTDSSGGGRVVNPIEERRGGRGRTVCAHQGPVQGNRGQPLGHTVPPAGRSLNLGCLTVITPIKKTNGFNLKDITLTAGFVPANGAWLSCSEQAPETGTGAHRAASWGQA